ncbi:MAG: tRNA 2-thiouridine(34) synthase MnmA [Patescibacteria group bacterium]|nr:tRNA 2-thiouridine(34) synthase MnmA [Patescibacteria group bacterium]
MSRNSNKKVCPERGRRVFVAMSGGVDSSVAALLLKNAGYNVTGVFMRCVSGELSRTINSPSTALRADCTAEADATDARRVAAHLDIPFYVFDFEEEYKRTVVEYMVDGYRQGITPNPDVMCNKEIKFGLFLKKALSLGADFIATGHYVRLSCSLFTARDTNKDQSYFLWTLTQKQLKHCLFPIGDYLKSEVREIARRAGLPTAEKKDSQGICFLGKVTLADFLKNYIPEEKGFVFTTAGEKLGEHNGAWFYTIGQRRIGIASGEPVYVADKDVKTNTIVVAEDSNNPALYRNEINLDEVNFIKPHPVGTIRPSTSLGINANWRMEILARVRYRQPLTKAILYNLTPTTYNLKFDQPQKFIAPGQSAVFYLPAVASAKEGMNEHEMLGGGVII